MNNETDIGIKFSNKITNEKKLEKYSQELGKIYVLLKSMDKGKMLAIQNTTEATTQSLKEQNKLMGTNSSESQKMARNFNLAFNYTTVRTFTRALKNVVTTMGNMVKQSASYLENMNLLDVAFNNNTKEADKFVNKLSEMYGLDESWGYRTVGIFKQLANAMGISAEAGDKLATILTQLSIDTASLYNIETSDAVSIFSSALAGQTKPARRLGADITQSTLQKTLDVAGIKEYVANLSYAEKRLLIVASLLQQLSQANNDWGRTIESVANQTRIMNEQWNRLTRAVGNVFLPIVKQLLPYLNAILMVFTEIINSIAILIGYNEDDFDYFKGAAENVADIETGAEGATSAVKKLNNSLRSFDRLNNITANAASGAGLGGGVGISPEIMKLFNSEVDKYNSTLDSIQMKATRIRDKIMEWLGFTKKINPLTKEISFVFDHITGGTVLGVLFAGGALVKGLKTIWSILQKIGIVKSTKAATDAAKNATTAFSKLKTTATGLLIGGTSLVVLNTTIKDISKNGANAANVLGSVAGVLGSIAGFAMAGSVFGGWGIAIGALVGGLSALVTAMLSYEDETDRVIEKTKKITQETRDYIQAVNDSYAEIDKNVSAKLSEHEQNSKLLQELDELVDKNGKVKEGYETRVNFIINELNNAYGTEMKVVDGVIKKYDDQKKKLEEVIKTEELEIIMQGKREKYMQALSNQTQDQARYDALKKTLEEAGIKAGEAKAKFEELSKTRVSFNIDVIKAKKQWQTLDKEWQEAQKEYDNLKDTIAKNSQIINEYQELTAAKVSGNLDEMNKAIDNSVNTIVIDGETIKVTLGDQLRYLENNYFDKLTNMTEEEYQKQREKLIEQLKTQSQTVREQTPEIAASWNYLAQTNSDEFLKAINSLPEEVEQQVISKMYQEGYQISEQLQKGINAKPPTIKFSADVSSVKATIQNLVNKGFFAPVSSGLYIDENGKLAKHANGGLPPVGQIFVANEKGPELVGQIGGQSFVANQNQIVDFLQEEIGNAKSNNPTTMNFYLDANHKLGTYTLEQLQGMAKTNGEPIRIGG